MINLLRIFITPFNPFAGYSKLESKPQIWPVVAFVLIVLGGTTAFHFSGPRYATSNFFIVSRLGFAVGLALRILLIAYALGILVSRMAKKRFGFRESFPIVVLASPVLLLPFLFYWMNPKSYIFTDYFSHLWFATLISIGIWKRTELTYIKSFALTLMAVAIFWLLAVTIVPYGMHL